MKRTDRPEDCFAITQNMSGFEKASKGYWYKFGEESECRRITDETWGKLSSINNIASTSRKEAMIELKKLCPGISESADIVFPFMLDYPSQIVVGENTFINMGFLHLSAGKLIIGKNCFIGPHCRFYTPNHAIDDLELRRAGWQYDASITIGDDVWFGGDVVVVPGVTIGNNVVVGAGSVVTKDISDNTVVAGNPAKIVRNIKNTKED